jgi:hypothetical protein
MKKYLPHLLIGITVFLLTFASYLYLKYLLPKAGEEVGKEQALVVDTTGKVDISETSRVDEATIPFKEAVLNKIWVEEVNFSSIDADGQDEDQIELTFRFLDGEVERKVTVPLLGEVYYGEQVIAGTETYNEEKGLTKVSEIPFEKGNLLTLSIAYIPEAKKPADFTKYCSQSSYPICNIHPSLGFGQNPVNFEEYFRRVYEVNGTLSSSYVAVTAVSRSPVKVK